MDLDRLRTFIRVAEVGSLSAASDVLRIAQPALSRQIRLLEDEVGQPLFLRSHSGMALTAAGAELLQRVSGLVRQLEQGFEDIRAFSEEPRGEVAIGMVHSVAAVVADALVARTMAEMPRVRLRLIEGYTGHILDWLHRREVDLAVIYGPAGELHLKARVLCGDELVLVAPPGTSLPEGPVTMPALAGRPLILPSAPHGLRMVIEKAAERAGVPLNVVIEASSFVTMLQLVAAGRGMTVQARSIGPRFMPEGRFAVRPFDPPLSRQVVLAEPPGPPASRAVQRVAAILTEETAALAR